MKISMMKRSGSIYSYLSEEKHLNVVAEARAKCQLSIGTKMASINKV